MKGILKYLKLCIGLWKLNNMYPYILLYGFEDEESFKEVKHNLRIYGDWMEQS